MLPSAKRPVLTFPALGLLLPQNGVMIGEGAMSLPASMDSRNGNLSNQQRPKDLSMPNKPRQESGYQPADQEGSLPCTPECQSDSELDVSGCDEGLDGDTRQLLSDFLLLHTGIERLGWNQNTPALSTMKRVVDSLLEKHRFAYNGMINRLSVNDRGDDVSFVSTVAESLFEDGTTNWGRVASLVAFGAVVCQYLKTKGRESCVEKVAQEISTYLLTDQRDWLVRNNAWEGFVDFFREHDPESKVRKTLMAVAGLAGIGATLAMLIR